MFLALRVCLWNAIFFISGGEIALNIDTDNLEILSKVEYIPTDLEFRKVFINILSISKMTISIMLLPRNEDVSLKKAVKLFLSINSNWNFNILL